MSNYTWACFDCRVTVRRPAMHSGDVPCPTCGAQCECLGHKIPVPPKSKPDEWNQVREHLNQVRLATAKAIQKRRAVRHAQILRDIAKLESLPENPGRTSLLKQLKKELASISA